jgi:hypothetical protein
MSIFASDMLTEVKLNEADVLELGETELWPINKKNDYS